jgi:hypothetical protein
MTRFRKSRSLLVDILLKALERKDWWHGEYSSTKVLRSRNGQDNRRNSERSLPYSHSVRLDHGIGIGIDIGKEIGIGISE